MLTGGGTGGGRPPLANKEGQQYQMPPPPLLAHNVKRCVTFCLVALVLGQRQNAGKQKKWAAAALRWRVQ